MSARNIEDRYRKIFIPVISTNQLSETYQRIWACVNTSDYNNNKGLPPANFAAWTGRKTALERL